MITNNAPGNSIGSTTAVYDNISSHILSRSRPYVAPPNRKQRRAAAARQRRRVRARRRGRA